MTVTTNGHKAADDGHKPDTQPAEVRLTEIGTAVWPNRPVLTDAFFDVKVDGGDLILITGWMHTINIAGLTDGPAEDMKGYWTEVQEGLYEDLVDAVLAVLTRLPQTPLTGIIAGVVQQRLSALEEIGPFLVEVNGRHPAPTADGPPCACLKAGVPHIIGRAS